MSNQEYLRRGDIFETREESCNQAVISKSDHLQIQPPAHDTLQSHQEQVLGPRLNQQDPGAYILHEYLSDEPYSDHLQLQPTAHDTLQSCQQQERGPPQNQVEHPGTYIAHEYLSDESCRNEAYQYLLNQKRVKDVQLQQLSAKVNLGFKPVFSKKPF